MNKLLLLLFIAASCSAPRQVSSSMKVTVTKVSRFGNKANVWVESNRKTWFATFENLPDSVMPGKVITLNQISRDTVCKCIFHRIK